MGNLIIARLNTNHNLTFVTPYFVRYSVQTLREKIVDEAIFFIIIPS